jgi:integrase/recombinase XerD
MTLTEAKSRYLAYRTQLGRTPHTLGIDELTLRQFLECCEQEDVLTMDAVTSHTLYRYEKSLLTFPKLSTRIGKLSVLRLFLRYAQARGWLRSELSSKIILPRKEETIYEHRLSVQEMKTFLSLPDTRSDRGVMDRAMLELLYSTGMRRMEMVNVNRYDYDREERTLRLRGKKGRERIVPVGKIASEWLERYLQIRPRYAQAKETALFVRMRSGRRITPWDIEGRVRYYGSSLKLTTHAFRHNCATHMLKEGASIRHVQQLLGHASLHTTEVYTHLDVKNLKDMLKACHPREQVSLAREERAAHSPVSQRIERTAAIQKKSAVAGT